MQEKDFTKLSEKEILIYKAVVDLINEGADIKSMKVGDITARAGIGKGTAYEYFTSKEEMVKEALIYATLMHITEVKNQVEAAENFRKKFYCILDYMENNRDQIRTFLWMVRIKGNEIDITALNGNSEQYEETLSRMSYFLELAIWFLAYAEAEGVITEPNKNYQISALISQIVQFGIYIHFGGPDQDLEEIKEFIYQGFVKQLN